MTRWPDIVVPRRHNYQMPFYPLNSSDIDVPPNVIGLGTGVCVSAYTHNRGRLRYRGDGGSMAQNVPAGQIRSGITRTRSCATEAVGLEDAEVIAVA